jgi:hypothetical protein
MTTMPTPSTIPTADPVRHAGYLEGFSDGLELALDAVNETMIRLGLPEGAPLLTEIYEAVQDYWDGAVPAAARARPGAYGVATCSARAQAHGLPGVPLASSPDGAD